MKKFVSGLVLGLILATTVPTFAAGLTATITNLTIRVNGAVKQLNAQPVSIAGTTYLPLRAIGDLLGYSVGYDSRNKSVSLDRQQAESGGEQVGNVLAFADGSTYLGGVKDGKPDGIGTMTYVDGKKYIGEWKDGQRSGQGTVILVDGRKYAGEWLNDTANGMGIYAWPDGQKYAGQWQNGKRNGLGVQTLSTGEKSAGEWQNDEISKQDTYLSAPTQVHTPVSNQPTPDTTPSAPTPSDDTPSSSNSGEVVTPTNNFAEYVKIRDNIQKRISDIRNEGLVGYWASEESYNAERNELQKERTDLQHQIDVLSLDDSFFATNKKKALQSQIDELNKDIVELQSRRERQLRIESLEDQLAGYRKSYLGY